MVTNCWIPTTNAKKKGRKKEHLAKLLFTSYTEYYYGVLFFQRKTKAIFLLKSSALRIFIPKISNLKNQQWPHARDSTFCDSFCFVSSVSNTEHIWNSRILEFQEFKKLTIIWSLARDATFCDIFSSVTSKSKTTISVSQNFEESHLYEFWRAEIICQNTKFCVSISSIATLKPKQF